MALASPGDDGRGRVIRRQQIGGPGDEFFSTYAREVLERFSAAEYAS